MKHQSENSNNNGINGWPLAYGRQSASNAAAINS